MAQFNRVGAGAPQVIDTITIPGATIGALTASVPKATALAGGISSTYPALRRVGRSSLVIFSWDNSDGTTWDAGLFILPSRVWVNSGVVTVDFNVIGASSFTPADHTYQVIVL